MVTPSPAAASTVATSVTVIDSLRTGLIVNGAFVVATAVLMTGIAFGSGPQSDLRQRCKAELTLAVQNFGFAAYLSAGSAFFGAIPFGSLALREHKDFLYVWVVGFILLLSGQLTVARVSAAAPATFSRIAALFFGIASTWWAWTGAR